MALAKPGGRRGCPGPLSFSPLIILSCVLASPSWGQIMAPGCPIGNPCSGGVTCCGVWSNCDTPIPQLETIHAALIHHSPVNGQIQDDSTRVLLWGYTTNVSLYANPRLWRELSRLSTDVILKIGRAHV